VITSDLVIETLIPPVAARGPLTEKQARDLEGLNQILIHGDGVLRIARMGGAGVGRSLVFLRISEAVERTVLGPAGAGLGSRLRAARSALLTDLVVAEAHRRHGVGSCLVADARELARAAGLARLTVEAQRDNVAAAMLYQRLGFEPAGDGDVVVYSTPV